MEENQTNEKKKSNVGLIIVIIILLLLILFAVWYFLLRDKKTNKAGDNENNTSEQGNKTDEPKEKQKYEYDYKDGVLTVIVDEEGNPKQTDFIIDGIILSGNRHSYDSESVDGNIAYLANKGYKKEGINSSFYLNEWIEIYLDTKYSKPVDDVKILALPHKKVEELEVLTLEQLEELANDNGGFVLDYKTPEEENYKYVTEGYINQDYPEGKYDILFTYQGKIAYFIVVDLTKEPTE